MVCSHNGILYSNETKYSYIQLWMNLQTCYWIKEVTYIFMYICTLCMYIYKHLYFIYINIYTYVYIHLYFVYVYTHKLLYFIYKHMYFMYMKLYINVYIIIHKVQKRTKTSIIEWVAMGKGHEGAGRGICCHLLFLTLGLVTGMCSL